MFVQSIFVVIIYIYNLDFFFFFLLYINKIVLYFNNILYGEVITFLLYSN